MKSSSANQSQNPPGNLAILTQARIEIPSLRRLPPTSAQLMTRSLECRGAERRIIDASLLILAP